MNTLVLTCLLSSALLAALGAQGPEAGSTAALTGGAGGSASGEGLTASMSYDDELDVDEELSGGDRENFSLHDFPASHDEKKKRKSKGRKKNKHRSKITTPLSPGYTLSSGAHTSTHPLSHSSTQDPCNSSHLSYCIHGYCKPIEGLQEPVCICMKGYDGERCEIQTLGSTNPFADRTMTELVQTVLVIIAVVLSVISCTAILLMTCAHYRSHKHFLASYLGAGTGAATASEQEKLQKPTGDVGV